LLGNVREGENKMRVTEKDVEEIKECIDMAFKQRIVNGIKNGYDMDIIGSYVNNCERLKGIANNRIDTDD
jgi:hypothetical protein